MSRLMSHRTNMWEGTSAEAGRPCGSTQPQHHVSKLICILLVMLVWGGLAFPAMRALAEDATMSDALAETDKPATDEGGVTTTDGTDSVHDRTAMPTDDGTLPPTMRQAVEFVARRPLFASLGAGGAILAVVATTLALSRYHNRPYALRRRRRHYVA